MDLRYAGGVFTASRLDADQQLVGPRTTTALFTGSIDPRDTFGELQGVGLVTQFGFEPVPEPRSLEIIFASAMLWLLGQRRVITKLPASP